MNLTFLLLALLACRTEEEPDDTQPTTDDTGTEMVDADADGYGPDEDCDDDIHPGADEHCD